MDVLFVTPKIMDESLSASTRLGVIGALARNTELTLIARYRSAGERSSVGYRILAIHAPRIPGLNMLHFMFAAARATWRALRTGNHDVILIEPLAVWPVALARILARKRTPIVLDMRTLPIETRGIRAKTDTLIAKLALRMARSVCASYTAITPGVAAWTSNLVDVPKSDIAIWGTGVDSTVFDPSLFPERSDGGETFDLLYHGALYRSRGLDSLIQAMTLLSGPSRSHTRMRIIGDGPDRLQLVELVERLALKDRVSIEGPVPLNQIPAAIAACDMGIIPLPDLPCWRTSSPTKLFELLAMGTPVIATSIDGHRLALGQSGAVVWAGQGSAEELALAIRAAYSDRDALTLSANNERAEHMFKYSWDAQARVLLDRLHAVTRA